MTAPMKWLMTQTVDGRDKRVSELETKVARQVIEALEKAGADLKTYQLWPVAVDTSEKTVYGQPVRGDKWLKRSRSITP